MRRLGGGPHPRSARIGESRSVPTTSVSAPAPPPPHPPGSWLHNAATGELGQLLVSTADSGGRRFEADLLLQPGAAVVGEHVHPHVAESFEVLQGRVGFSVGGVRRESVPGDGAIEVAAGVAHDW